MRSCTFYHHIGSGMFRLDFFKSFSKFWKLTANLIKLINLKKIIFHVFLTFKKFNFFFFTLFKVISLLYFQLGVDGFNSFVRKAAGIGAVNYDYKQWALVSTLKIDNKVFSI